jgi:hypothetical protein
MSKNKNARIKDGRQLKSWARRADLDDGCSDDDIVTIKGGGHLSAEVDGAETAANNSNIIPGREQERLERLKLAISELHGRRNSQEHVQSPKKTERPEVTAPLPIGKRPLSSPDFWFAFRANMHGRSESEERKIVHEIHAQSKINNELIKKVKTFQLKLEDGQQTGCTIDDVLRLAAAKEKPMERDRIMGGLTIRHAGAVGIVPKKIAAELFSVVNKKRTSTKSEALLEFLRACREMVPACSWSEALELWKSFEDQPSEQKAKPLDQKAKPMTMQELKEKITNLSVEARIEGLLKELDDFEDAHRLVHARQARLKGSGYGKVDVDNHKSTVHVVKGSLAVLHKEYRMLDPDYISLGKAEGIDPTFAINYNALRQWLATARALRRQTEEMRKMLKDAQSTWYVFFFF